MKFHLLFLSIISALGIKAQEFKPYKIESGKITYETLRYSTVSGYSNKNGVETSYSKQVPYVAEQVIYYWDEFGDVAFEETYQVSNFGGKLLPEKVKIGEHLWVDEHRYYYNSNKNKVSNDPYHLRIKCKENFQYYQIKDSWVETLYMGTEKSGTLEILEKETDYYTINKYQDIYTWKGLVLKNESFSTTVKGARLHPNRSKIALEIDTTSVINKEIFNPIWLKRQKLYNSLDDNKIGEIVDARPDLIEQAEIEEGLKIQKNDILLFVTKRNFLGKMQVLDITKKNQLKIKYSIYSFGKEVISRELVTIENNTSIDLDSPDIVTNQERRLEFKWEVTENANIFPLNNKSILLFKTSRTKTLAITPCKRTY